MEVDQKAPASNKEKDNKDKDSKDGKDKEEAKPVNPKVQALEGEEKGGNKGNGLKCLICL